VNIELHNGSRSLRIPLFLCIVIGTVCLCVREQSVCNGARNEAVKGCGKAGSWQGRRWRLQQQAISRLGQILLVPE
jgi:hypothetical protein